MSAFAALVVAVALAGCGTTTYFAGRTLPPSGLTNRVLIAIQNPSSLSNGTLQFVDAFYDIRYRYNSTNVAPAFSISGYSGNLPITIQNMPEEQLGAVYGFGDGSFNIVSYSGEKNIGGTSGLNGHSSSIFTTRNQAYIFAASQASHVLTIVDKSSINAGTYPLSLPGVYRVSVNPAGTAALAFVQNSNYVYYPRKLTAAQTAAYSGGPNTWPLGAVDCEPQNEPGWCLFQALDPGTGNPLSFNRPIKAVFSADGGTAYVLNCGPECGGTSTANPAATPLSNASVTLMPVAPLIFLIGQASGTLPTQTALSANCATAGSTGGCSIPIPGGASNALVDSSTMYVVGQQMMTDGFWGGHLTVLNLSNNTASSPISISDGEPGAVSRILLADDNTLWIAMVQCTNGERANNGQPDGCLTMVNTTNNTATLLPYIGDATGIAAVTGLHKVYTAEGGQVYIYSTVDGSSIDNQFVTVTGTAYDVAYMDATTDGNNTVY
ncbi:MAG: hypothetical protein ABSE51_15160 [Terracidiphilus sp.]|jgi:hypothetical protein